MDSSRSFEEVPLLVTGVQLRKHRFGDSKIDEHELPPLAQGRCNLTALSHVHNLYFIAYAGRIFVYQPRFPTQALPSSPVLVIDTQPSGPGLRGDIDSRKPHAINNLVVQVLGHSEVLAVVRDDGDVDAYLTRHVQHAIEKRCQTGNTLGLDAIDVKPFFQRNVGQSAWGLAIHTQARMIAVSSNNFKITVFTFALTQEGVADVDEGFPDEEQTYYSDSDRTPPADRKKNDVRIIKNGNANIPSIAFCNVEGQDPIGRWLLSTDIAGVIRSWDVHKLARAEAVRAAIQPTNRWPFNWDPSPVSYDGFNAGWSIMFLPPQSFSKTGTLSKALGLPAGPEQIDIKKAVWDASGSIEHIQSNAHSFSYRPPMEVVDGDYLNPTGSQPDVVQGRHVSGSSPTNNTGRDRIDPEVEAEDESSSEDSDFLDGTDDSADFGPPQVYVQGSNSLCDLRCPIMHASISTICLFQPSKGKSAEGHAPIITLSNMLRQDLPRTPRYYNMAVFDRCNMHAQIPSLGVVVLASQKGRAAVMSLTQLKTDAPDPAASSGLSYKRVYGYRVDHILPLASQEAAGHRPISLLHGIAVGPIQGSENAPDDLKRWRLLLMYQDHSILSYEIGRTEPDGIECGGLDVMI